MGEMDNFVYVKEKCNIKVIDLSVDCGGKMEGRKKPDSMMNDVCSRTSDKKYVKTKTPDSSCKNLTTNYRQYNNETSKPSPTRTLALPSNNGGCSRTTPVTFKHLSQQDPEVKCQNGNVDNISSLAIKKEPMDFQKYSSNSPFFSFTPLDGLFNSSSVRVPDGQLLSAVPYSDSYESSSRVKETFLSPRGENTYLSSSQSYSSPIPVPNQVFLSRNLEHGEFSSYDKCGNLSKMNEEYLMNSDVGKILQGSQSCLPVEEDRIALEGGSLVNSTTSEREPKNVSSKTTSCSSVNVTPCQVAEVTSASSLLSPKMPSVNPVVIKQEAVSIASGSGMLSADQKQEVTFTASGQSTAVSSTGKLKINKIVAE